MSVSVSGVLNVVDPGFGLGSALCAMSLRNGVSYRSASVGTFTG
jgi:hypothetical protein